eukprot:g3377.t1
MVDAAQLYQPAFWSNPENAHQLFTRMRAEAPVLHCQGEGYPDFWHVTKYHDIFEIEKRTDVFLSAPRTIVQTNANEDYIRQMTGGTLAPVRTLVNMDNPEHQKMRLLTQAWFMPKNLAKLNGGINQSIDTAIAALREKNGQCDFAKDVAIEYPLRVIMEVLGVPTADYPMMLRLTQETFGPEDPDTKPDAEHNELAQAESLLSTVQEFSAYCLALVEERRQNPKEDISTLLANATIDGEPIDPLALIGYFIIIATAGHDTTSYSLTEAVRQMAMNPEVLERLKADPDTVAPKIVEEAIRVASPVRHFIRTAKEDYELRGQTIKAGDSVILWYTSGSRDEDIFDQPHTFDIDRDQSVRHAAFGHGAHICLGMHLARQENTAFLKRFGQEVSGLKLLGDAKYTQANFVSGIKSMPVEITLA